MSQTDTKRRLFICCSRLVTKTKVPKKCFSKGGILWRFVIKICLIKRSTEVIRTQWQNFLQDPRIVRKHTIDRVRQAMIQIRLRICAVWSESSLGSFWIAKNAMFFSYGQQRHWSVCANALAYWVFVGRALQIFIFSRYGSYADHWSWFFFFFFFFDLGFTALSRIFHLYRADRSSKVGENRRTRRKTTWPSVSRTWLSHIWPEPGSNHSGEKPNGSRVNSLIH